MTLDRTLKLTVVAVVVALAWHAALEGVFAGAAVMVVGLGAFRWRPVLGIPAGAVMAVLVAYAPIVAGLATCVALVLLLISSFVKMGFAGDVPENGWRVT